MPYLRINIITHAMYTQSRTKNVLKKMFFNFKKNSKKIWRKHFPTKAKMLKKGRNEIRAAIKKYLFKCQNDINKKVSFLCSNYIILWKIVSIVFRQISEPPRFFNGWFWIENDFNIDITNRIPNSFDWRKLSPFYGKLFLKMLFFLHLNEGPKIWPHPKFIFHAGSLYPVTLKMSYSIDHLESKQIMRLNNFHQLSKIIQQSSTTDQ